MKKLILIIIPFFIFSCDKSDDCGCGVAPPNDDLEIHISGIDNYNEQLNDISLYYLEGDKKNEISLLNHLEESIYKYSELMRIYKYYEESSACVLEVENVLTFDMREVLIQSVEQGVNTFYLQIGKDIDTLYVVGEEDYDYLIKEIKLNNEEGTLVDNNPLGYLFSKQKDKQFEYLPNDTPLKISVADLNLIPDFWDGDYLKDNTFLRKNINISYKQDLEVKFIELSYFDVIIPFYYREDNYSIYDYENCTACRSKLFNYINIYLPMEVLNLATRENNKISEFYINLNGISHTLTIDEIDRIPIEDSTIDNLSYDEFKITKVSIDGASLFKGYFANHFFYSETWKKNGKSSFELWSDNTECTKIENCSN